MDVFTSLFIHTMKKLKPTQYIVIITNSYTSDMFDNWKTFL